MWIPLVVAFLRRMSYAHPPELILPFHSWRTPALSWTCIDPQKPISKCLLSLESGNSTFPLRTSPCAICNPVAPSRVVRRQQIPLPIFWPPAYLILNLIHLRPFFLTYMVLNIHDCSFYPTDALRLLISPLPSTFLTLFFQFSPCADAFTIYSPPFR